MRRDVYQAIADPNRKATRGLLADQQLSLTSATKNFDVSRPAISGHIRILAECGRVVIHRRGRERYCEARLVKLNEVSNWIEHCRRVWTERLDILEDYLRELQAKEKKHGRKK